MRFARNPFEGRWLGVRHLKDVVLLALGLALMWLGISELRYAYLHPPDRSPQGTADTRR